MNIKIHAHQLEMSDSLRAYAERHIAEALTTIYKGSAATLDIEFSEAVGGREKICRVNVFVPRGKTLVASAQDANLYAAVDLVAEKIARELRQYKEKRQDSVRQGVRSAEAAPGATLETTELEEFDSDEAYSEETTDELVP